MKSIALLLGALATAQAVDFSISAQPSYSPVVCAMTVCPTATALVARDIECPDYCNGKCKIVDDPCCPGTQKVVCDELQTYNGSITIGSSSTSSPMVSAFNSASATATAALTSITSAAQASSVAPTSSAPQATQSPASSGAESNRIVVLGSMCLMMLGALAVQAL